MSSKAKKVRKTGKKAKPAKAKSAKAEPATTPVTTEPVTTEPVKAKSAKAKPAKAKPVTSTVKFNKGEAGVLVSALTRFEMPEKKKLRSVLKDLLPGNQRITKVLLGKVQVALKKYAEEHSLEVQPLLESFNSTVERFQEILRSKPKKVLVPYMRFSVEYGLQHLKGVPLGKERAQKIKDQWVALSEEERQKYQVPPEETLKYKEAQKAFEMALKEFGSLKNTPENP
jgi:hypothetical protein